MNFTGSLKDILTLIDSSVHAEIKARIVDHLNKQAAIIVEEAATELADSIHHNLRRIRTDDGSLNLQLYINNELKKEIT